MKQRGPGKCRIARFTTDCSNAGKGRDSATLSGEVSAHDARATERRSYHSRWIKNIKPVKIATHTYTAEQQGGASWTPRALPHAPVFSAHQHQQDTINPGHGEANRDSVQVYLQPVQACVTVARRCTGTRG